MSVVIERDTAAHCTAILDPAYSAFASTLRISVLCSLSPGVELHVRTVSLQTIKLLTVSEQVVEMSDG